MKLGRDRSDLLHISFLSFLGNKLENVLGKFHESSKLILIEFHQVTSITKQLEI